MMKMKKTEKQKILIVDDKPVNIFSVEKLLENKNRIFLQALNGNEALKIAFNQQVDLIILDVNMPGMDGFEVAQLLKSNKRTKDIPIIFASAEKKEQKSIMKGFEEGAIDYLFKPLDPEITKAKVSVMLQIQKQRKELIEKNNSLAKSALLIENSADIIGIVDIAAFRFEEVNSAFTAILGYSKEESNNISLSLLLSDEDRIKLQDLIQQGKEKLSFETRVYAKDRSIKWLHWNVINKSGKWFVNARDITEVKEVEKIRNYLATIVKQSNDSVYIIDDANTIISWNDGATKMYGYTEKEALDMKVWNIIPEYLHQETLTVLNNLRAGQSLNSVETKRITKHGKIIDVLLSSSVIVDNDSNTKSISVTEKDITQQKIADAEIKKLNNELKDKLHQLEVTNKELESFSYSVSHDLRAPLRAISGFTGIIKYKFSAEFNDEVNRLLNIVKESAEQMGNLIEDLLKFSRLGKQALSFASINMCRLIEEILAEFTVEEKYKIENNITKTLVIRADLLLMKQVFVNLISNAIKYTSKKENPHIIIASEIKENECLLYVKDNGAGFNMRYYDKLFGVFQRLHSDKEYEGTGVGLSIVQRIITRHGGRIWAEAEENVGATFYLSFPKSIINSI